MPARTLLERIETLESRRDSERLRRLADLEPRDAAAATAADRSQTRTEGSFLNLIRREMARFRVSGMEVLNIRGRYAPSKRHTVNQAWVRLSEPIGEVEIRYTPDRHIVSLERFGASKPYSFTKAQIKAAKWRPVYMFHEEDLFSSVETSVGATTKRAAAKAAVKAIKRLAKVVKPT